MRDVMRGVLVGDGGFFVAHGRRALACSRMQTLSHTVL